jgi:hypothetical protein
VFFGVPEGNNHRGAVVLKGVLKDCSAFLVRPPSILGAGWTSAFKATDDSARHWTDHLKRDGGSDRQWCGVDEGA